MYYSVFSIWISIKTVFLSFWIFLGENDFLILLSALLNPIISYLAVRISCKQPMFLVHYMQNGDLCKTFYVHFLYRLFNEKTAFERSS